MPLVQEGGVTINVSLKQGVDNYCLIDNFKHISRELYFLARGLLHNKNMGNMAFWRAYSRFGVKLKLTSPLVENPLLNHLKYKLPFNRLWNIIIHACFNTLFPVTLHGMGSHGNDWDLVKSIVSDQTLSRKQ